MAVAGSLVRIAIPLLPKGKIKGQFYASFFWKILDVDQKFQSVFSKRPFVGEYFTATLASFDAALSNP